MNGLEGKAALVTGGSRGIGEAVVRRLSAEGARVAFTYVRDEARAAALVKDLDGPALALRADSADPAAVRGAVAETVRAFGGLDVLVNNAGAFHVGALADLGDAEIEQTLAVNVRAPYEAARAAAPHLPEGGRIITIGSNTAVRLPFPGFALYAMSKTALVGLTKGLARELGPRGITATLVHPGPTDTDANPASSAQAPTVAALTALDRYAAPHEIAATVAFLCGPDATYVTGAEIAVDGGWGGVGG
ncbi:3-oxoacyl-[acyl-carrier protein] reductase [Streptomyces sp. SolWspMP-sol7th]|uniref:SDR family NAD(P)-dependent oxidoreductase n=1 Tax=Streptomyces sp. SolWspMP-sol7th TaxID=1839776 RepID=UPI00081E2B50|nr:SDR family oxidoreductase [Streptomyces sp. SolWspMP-sol7th]SCD38881.1 3-oxoacyl-[acyl-carrier protein] reductase [Streptomyces sp. SolWspMP-sol7th]